MVGANNEPPVRLEYLGNRSCERHRKEYNEKRVTIVIIMLIACEMSETSGL